MECVVSDHFHLYCELQDAFSKNLLIALFIIYLSILYVHVRSDGDGTHDIEHM